MYSITCSCKAVAKTLCQCIVHIRVQGVCVCMLISFLSGKEVLMHVRQLSARPGMHEWRLVRHRRSPDTWQPLQLSLYTCPDYCHDLHYEYVSKCSNTEVTAVQMCTSGREHALRSNQCEETSKP